MFTLRCLFLCVLAAGSITCVPGSAPALSLQGDFIMQARQARGRLNFTSACSLIIHGFEVSPGPPAYLVAHVQNARDAILLPTQGSSRGFNQSSGAENVTVTLANTTYSFADLTLLQLVEFYEPESRVLASFNPLSTTQNSTVFLENCLQVTPAFRFRWTLLGSEIDIGLEATLPEGGYMGLGPAQPGVTKSIMAGADVYMAGIVDQRPFLVDGFISGYNTCNYGSATQDVDGVCDDYSWAGRNASADNLQLLYSHQFEGVTFFRFRRALKTSDEKFDHEITPFTPQSFAYALGATGPLWAPGTSDQKPWAGPQFQQHGLESSLSYGQLSLILASSVHSCLPFDNLDTPSLSAASGSEQSMWPHSAALTSDGSVTLRWAVQSAWVTFSLQTSKVARWLALGFGPGMVGGFSYVGWIDPQGVGRVDAYAMVGQAVSGMQLAQEPLFNVSVAAIGGKFTVEFTRALQPNNSVSPPLDPQKDMSVLWAVGRQWDAPGRLDDSRNVHYDRSGKPTLLSLTQASTDSALVAAPVHKELDARWVQHGWALWAAFLVLGPATALLMRFTSERWRALPQYALFAGLVLVAVGLGMGLLAAGASSPFLPSASLHAKVGVAVLLLFLWEFLIGLWQGSRSDPHGGREWVAWALAYYLPGAGMLLLALWDVLLGLAQAHALGIHDRTFKTLVLASWYFWIPFVLIGLLLEGRRLKRSKTAKRGSHLLGALCVVCVALIIGVSFLIHRLSVSPVPQFTSFSQGNDATLASQAVGPINSVSRAYSINFTYTEPAQTPSPTFGPTSSPSAPGFTIVLTLRRQAEAAFDPQALAQGIAQSFQANNVSVPSIRVSWPKASNYDNNGSIFINSSSSQINGSNGNATSNDTFPVSIRFESLQSSLHSEELEQLTNSELPRALMALGFSIIQAPTQGVLALGNRTLSTLFPSNFFVFQSSNLSSSSPNFRIRSENASNAKEQGSSFSLFTAAPSRCPANSVHLVGDGWCDTQPSVNGPECHYDGGDCCNTSSPRFRCLDPLSPYYLQSSANGTYPAPLNPRYTVQIPRVESSSNLVQTYNNYYEFGFSKDIYSEALKHSAFFNATNWIVEIGGLVERPLNVSVAELLNLFPLETRLYRHRCVEAWSIVVPWVGFPLAALLEEVKPLPDAKFIRFETWLDPTVSIGQEMNTGYPYPYVEGLTVEEGMNELSFLSVGQYQQPLPPQSGAPIRLTIPWKYGFKSIKAIKSIKLVTERPNTFWENASQGLEYGFWANVNPKFPHRRWSQSNERFLQNSASTSTRLKTLIYNGYEAQVQSMYAKIEAAGIEDLWH